MGSALKMKIEWHPESNVVATVKSIDNTSVRLTEERWLHIVEYHKELANFLLEVLLTVTEPDRVYQSPSGMEPNFAAVKTFDRFADFGLAKNLIVHYKELSQSNGFILTAFVMSDKTLKKRFKLWQKLK
jgi:acetylornithine/succinyldiaminopimelate/putrescine aminotransferase